MIHWFISNIYSTTAYLYHNSHHLQTLSCRHPTPFYAKEQWFYNSSSGMAELLAPSIKGAMPATLLRTHLYPQSHCGSSCEWWAHRRGGYQALANEPAVWASRRTREPGFLRVESLLFLDLPWGLWTILSLTCHLSPPWETLAGTFNKTQILFRDAVKHMHMQLSSTVQSVATLEFIKILHIDNAEGQQVHGKSINRWLLVHNIIPQLQYIHLLMPLVGFFFYISMDVWWV